MEYEADFIVCSLFDDAEITSLVKATIDLLQSDHRTFSLSTGMCLPDVADFPRFGLRFLGAKLSLDQVPGGLAGAGKIDAVLTGASLFYAL